MFEMLRITFISAIFAILLCISPQANGAEILGVFTSHSPSHLIIHMAMARILTEQGHNVTVVSSMEWKGSLPANITHIWIPPRKEHQEKLRQIIEGLINKTNKRFQFLNSMRIVVDAQYELMLHPSFTQLYESKFDLVIVGYFMNVYQLGLAAKFNCPLIVSWVGGLVDMSDNLSGNPSEISYVPTLYMPSELGEVMNFQKRVETFISHMYTRLVIAILEYRMENYYNELFANEKNFPTYDQMKKRISLMFSNYHSVSEGPIRPILPSFVEVGGLQNKETPDPLPKDIDDFLSGANDGAILLSLGTNVKDHMLKASVSDAMFKILSTLKQRVIWKWEDLDHVPGNSPNILFKKWLPQGDILAHPHTKLFIMHAGKGGAAEVQYHGVPIVALPFFGDQFGLAESLVRSGFGLSLDLANLTEQVFRATILEVLENPKYAANVKKYSKFYRDRPMTARQTFIYWTEYVLRHNGSLHLQSPALHMNFIERNNLDIYSLIIAIVFGVYLLTKIVARRLFKKSVVSVKVKTK